MVSFSTLVLTHGQQVAVQMQERGQKLFFIEWKYYQGWTSMMSDLIRSTFNTCIKAWCNSNRPDCALKAEEVLAKLENDILEYPKRAGGMLKVRPNRLSYTYTCINAWAKSQRPESLQQEAEAILLRMLKSFKSDVFSTITPDAHTFSSVLNALAKSRSTKSIKQISAGQY